MQHRALKQQAAKSWLSKLAPSEGSDAFHMAPVRAIHARVEAEAPIWDPNYKMLTSRRGETFEERFVAGMDSVNTASLEGVLANVQAESINYRTRSDADRCVRKNDAKFVVFYDVVFAQTNETLALYEAEYGAYLAMVDGQCTSKTGICDYINGDFGAPQIGPFVGRERPDSDPRAPYPNTYRFSFPNSAPKLKSASKTEAARAATRSGLCNFDQLPDGVACTYNYRIAGYVPLDDVVGITKMPRKSGSGNYSSFAEFCADGGVEFMASTKDGKWEQGIDFWREPQNATENARRAGKLVGAYAAMLAARKSAQVEATVIANTMTALPSVATLTRANPPCYRNIKACSGPFGCKRGLFSQACFVCAEGDKGCTVKPPEFEFPELTKAVGKYGSTGDALVEAASEPSHSGNDALLWGGVGAAIFMVLLVALAAYRQRRRVREPTLKAFLLSQSTRNGAALPPCIELTVHRDLQPPAVALPANLVVVESQRV